MKVTHEMMRNMISALNDELGKEHYYLCKAASESRSNAVLEKIWPAIIESHRWVMQSYLKVCIGADGLATLLKVYGTEEKIHSIICAEADFGLSNPHFDELYKYIPALLRWVEQTHIATKAEDNIR